MPLQLEEGKMNTKDTIDIIDLFLIELGCTSGIIDARKVRDHLLDMRLMFMVEEIEDVPVGA